MKDGITDFSIALLVKVDENFVISADNSSMNYT
jgi:hypothetical protein